MNTRHHLNSLSPFASRTLLHVLNLTASRLTSSNLDQYLFLNPGRYLTRLTQYRATSIGTGLSIIFQPHLPSSS